MTSEDSKTCFVLVPFAQEFKNQWELAITPAIQDVGLIPFRGDQESFGSGVIMQDVTQSVYDAQIVVADLTGKNPNVMYELGLAHAARKPVVMIAQNDADIPFDLSHIRYLKYNPHDLSRLREELAKRLRSTLNMEPEQLPKFFPQLEILDAHHLRELNYFREQAVAIDVHVFPPTADIFFNDVLIGQTPKTLLVNPNATRNSISLFAIDYFEHHFEISDGVIESKEIVIELTPRSYSEGELLKRVPSWLRWRREYPENPVLMGAVLNFLKQYGTVEEAHAEADLLLQAAPGWYASHNQAGWVFQQNDIERGRACYRKVIALRPNHYIGYFNLACAESLAGRCKECLDALNAILADDERMKSFACAPEQFADIAPDSDFDAVRTHRDFSKEFETTRQQLIQKHAEFGAIARNEFEQGAHSE